MLITKIVKEKNDKLFVYVRSRIKQNFLETWHYVSNQFVVCALPVVFTAIYFNRALCYSDAGEIAYDFSDTLAK